MKITIIGTGYVGLVTGTCFSELGNEVICVDSNHEKIASLQKGAIPIFEPGLEELIHRNVTANRLSFSTDLEISIQQADLIFIAVGTPSKPNGDADLSFVEAVAKEIALHAKTPKVVVEKSTVPVETGKMLFELLQKTNGHNVKFEVASNPEFLREGTAVYDFLHPDRIVIGTDGERARQLLTELYSPLKVPLIFTDISSAELIKHAANSFLALKISYANALAELCEKTGANIEDVIHGMGLDKRIGHHFFNAGIGYGGSCFPKDVDAFISIAKTKGIEFSLLDEVQKINLHQRKRFIEKTKTALGSLKGKTIAVLGLSFKPDTDDLRNAPSLDIVPALQQAGALVRAFDPIAMKNAQAIFKGVTFCENEWDALSGADAVLILTEWGQFKEMDWEKAKKILKAPLVIDGRNVFQVQKMKKLNIRYISVGRMTV